MSPAQIESILTTVASMREGRSLTVKQFQRLLGLMEAASNMIPLGLLYMRPLQWWLKTRLQMIKVTRWYIRALDMWRLSSCLRARCWELLVAKYCCHPWRMDVLAGPSFILRPDFFPQRLPMGDSHYEGSPLTDRGTIFHPSPDLWKLWVWPLKGHSS